MIWKSLDLFLAADPPWTKVPKQVGLFGLCERVNECVKRWKMLISGEERMVIIIDDASLLEVLAGGAQNAVLAFCTTEEPYIQAVM